MPMDADIYFYYCLATWGLSNILARMKVSRLLRYDRDGNHRTNPVSQMLGCPACNGFWIGVVLSPIVPLYPVCPWLDWFLQGCFTSATCWSLFALTNSTGVYDQ